MNKAETAAVLADIDAYIARCPDPDTPYYPDKDSPLLLNIRQVRDEIARGTPLGQEAMKDWQGMRDAEKTAKKVS